MNNKRLLLSQRIRSLVLALSVFALWYSLTNYYSAAAFIRYPERIHTLAIALDQRIDFVPATIIPYSWSLLLFVASFFMVRTTKQLSQLTRRLILTTLLACLIFYLYPARFSFVRPMTSDWSALGYRFLQLTDKPYNQLPSLHVSYALLLGVSLWNIKEGCHKAIVFIYRIVLAIVCMLIIISTVFTYQHHLLDVLGGLILAAVVLLIVHKLRNILVLKYLGLAIAGFLLIAIGGFFIAQVTSRAWTEYISLVFGSYWGASFLLLARLYQKDAIDNNKYWFRKNHQGKISLFTWSMFAPLLLSYKLMAKLAQQYASYQSATPFEDQAKSSYTKVSWYKINEKQATIATPRGLSPKLMLTDITAPSQLIVIDVAAEINSHYYLLRRYLDTDEQNKTTSAAHSVQAFDAPQLSLYYLYLPLLDLQPLHVSDAAILLDLFQQIDSLSNLYKDSSLTTTWLNFHCVMGFSRSIAVQALYLLYCDKLMVEQVHAWINQHYPQAHLSEHYLPLSLMKAIANSKNKP